MTNPDFPDDTPRDEHLRAALRHAPDAGLQPPPHLRAQVVAAAHRALAEPGHARSPARPRWAWWPGPLGASGALASLMLAGFIGLMWQGTPPGPALDEPPETTPPARLEVPELRASAPWPRTQSEMSTRSPIAPDAPATATAPAPATAPPPAPAPAPATPPPPVPAVAKAAPPPAPPPPPSNTPAPATAAPAMAAAESPAPEPHTPASEPGSAAPPLAAATPPAAPAAPVTMPPAAPPAEAAQQAPLAPRPAPRPAPLAAPAPAIPVMPAAPPSQQVQADRAQSARNQTGETAGATPAAPMRWRIDGVERGTASLGWAQAAYRLDRRLGQPTELLELDDARQVDLVEPSGTVTRLWLGATRLLWCPADRNACRLSTLEPATAASLLGLLPAAAAAGAQDQVPKRDSR